MVNAVIVWGGRLRQRQAHLIAVLSGQPAYCLEHAVEDGHGKVTLGIWQLALVVCAGGAAQSQVSLALQVGDKDRPLPWLAIVNEIPRHLRHHLGILSDQRLLPLT